MFENPGRYSLFEKEQGPNYRLGDFSFDGLAGDRPARERSLFSDAEKREIYQAIEKGVGAASLANDIREYFGWLLSRSRDLDLKVAGKALRGSGLVGWTLMGSEAVFGIGERVLGGQELGSAILDEGWEMLEELYYLEYWEHHLDKPLGQVADWIVSRQYESTNHSIAVRKESAAPLSSKRRRPKIP